MHIKVLGSGCPTCKKLHEKTEEAVKALGLEATVEYVTGVEGTKQIIESGALASPVLTVDGTVAMTGYSPDIAVVKKKILAAIKEA